eukprot:TRINITY_DN3195_c0_g1_i1.p2 TRINITY_DN3195_c0_g1~~TRINITY_DN3195_c0_g1_i1.p2  ORF type:complete len:173 (+),score=5.96 TRINITY_DN3195_c0_g1_i1:638-1156(+)
MYAQQCINRNRCLGRLRLRNSIALYRLLQLHASESTLKRLKVRSICFLSSLKSSEQPASFRVKIFNQFLVAKNGKAHMLLKLSSKPRKRKAELEVERRAKEEEKQHIENLKNAEVAFHTKRYKFEDALHAIDQNEKLVTYLKQKGAMDEEGNIKLQSANLQQHFIYNIRSQY